MRSRLPLLIGLLVIGVLVWLWRDTQAPLDTTTARSGSAEPGSTRTVAGTARSGRPASAAEPSIGEARREAAERGGQQPVYPGGPAKFDPTVRHSVDPCTAPTEPRIPQGFEQITEGGITVAWDAGEPSGPFDKALRPVSLAHAVAGVLEEAAQLTGTERRQTLTVIVDASAQDMQQRMKTPEWVHGLYDGAAIHLPAKGNADLGVVMATMRHELMHAQLHATVGCTPFWFDEGMATYFAGELPMREWMQLLRTADQFDITSVNDPAVLDLARENAARLYAISLAMVVYLAHHGGEDNLRAVVRVAQANTQPRDALELWERVAPAGDYRTVLESLAQKIFGLPLGSELEGVLRGPLCCRNLRIPTELACRAAGPNEPSEIKRDFCHRW